MWCQSDLVPLNAVCSFRTLIFPLVLFYCNMFKCTFSLSTILRALFIWRLSSFFFFFKLWKLYFFKYSFLHYYFLYGTPIIQILSLLFLSFIVFTFIISLSVFFSGNFLNPIFQFINLLLSCIHFAIIPLGVFISTTIFFLLIFLLDYHIFGSYFILLVFFFPYVF